MNDSDFAALLSLTDHVCSLPGSMGAYVVPTVHVIYDVTGRLKSGGYHFKQTSLLSLRFDNGSRLRFIPGADNVEHAVLGLKIVAWRAHSSVKLFDRQTDLLNSRVAPTNLEGYNAPSQGSKAPEMNTATKLPEPNTWKVISLKYAGNCMLCGLEIAPGNSAYWRRNPNSQVAHIQCPAYAVKAKIGAWKMPFAAKAQQVAKSYMMGADLATAEKLADAVGALTPPEPEAPPTPVTRLEPEVYGYMPLEPYEDTDDEEH